MSWPAIKQAFTQEEFRRYVSTLAWVSWRPSYIMWHNTAAPTLAQWKDTAAKDAGRGVMPGQTRINSLEAYYRDQMHWSGGPHLFIDDEHIWVFNPLTAPGVHSPSYNRNAIGIEHVGDFAREDDDSGAGLRVKNNGIFATALLCGALGLDPQHAIKLHKEDPRTTHDCPGRDMAEDKQAMMDAVDALMAGGEHAPEDVVVAIGIAPAPAPVAERTGTVEADDLNFRAGPGVQNESKGSLPRGTIVAVLGEARNGTTSWLNVRTPAGYVGWVAGRYVKVA